jgi:tetratricopeptide (TPR) repeat protein
MPESSKIAIIPALLLVLVVVLAMSVHGLASSASDVHKADLLLIHKGDTLYREGNLTGAIYYYKQALAINPRDLYAWSNIGLALLKEKNYTGAVNMFNRVLSLAPNHVNALVGKSYAILELHDYPLVIALSDQAIKRNPSDAAAWDDKGVALLKLGNPKASLQYFDKAISLNPRAADAGTWNRMRISSAAGPNAATCADEFNLIEAPTTIFPDFSYTLLVQ